MEVTAEAISGGLTMAGHAVERCFPSYMTGLKFLRDLPFFGSRADDLFWSLDVKAPFVSRRFARAHPAAIHHVVDHSFAHLLEGLPHPRVVTVHDLFPLRFPELSNAKGIGHQRFLQRVRKTALADLVLCDSQCTANDVISLLGVQAERVRVVPLMLLGVYRPPTKEERLAARAALGVDPEELLLAHGGSGLARKNLAFLIQVLDAVQGRVPAKGRWHFFQVGGKFNAEATAALAASSIRDFVTQIDYQPNLKQLFAAADLLIFPSVFEGFGLPPIEAMASGVPVAVSDGGSLPEYAGPYTPLKVNDKAAWTEHLVRLIEDKEERLRHVEAGLLHAQQYTIEKIIPKIEACYREVLENQKRNGSK